MLFADIAVLTPEGTIAEHQYVAVQNGRIAYVGDTCPPGDFGERYDGQNRLLLPGFVNAHTHTPMTLLRGYAENLPLDRWLNERVFPFEDRIQGEDAYFAALLAIAEMVSTGTTSFSDMYYFSDDVLRAVRDSGMKCNFSRAITSFRDGDIHALQSFQESERILAEWQGTGDGRIQIDMSLHAEYTNRRTIIEQFAKIAADHGVRAHIHLSETEKEHTECKARYGLTPAALFSACGVFQVPTTAAHCVWVEPQDVEIFRAAGVSVATNPASNLKLGSGVCDTVRLLENGVNVAIGTDSAASNNNLDMYKELYLCALLPKGFLRRPDVLSERTALKMATENGYIAQGRTDCGRVKEGRRADLQVVDLHTVRMTPHHDTVNNLVYAASGAGVLLTMVDGRVLYRDGKFPTIDIEKVKFEVEARAARIRAEVASHG